MAEINKITSFKTFSEVKATQVAAQLAEDNATKRSGLATKISALLDEMEINSFEDLAEDTKREFITKAFGSVSEEDIVEGINLKAAHLSSSEYQKAQKLKAFNSGEWEWNGETGLYDSIKESVVTEAKNTIGLAFKEEKEYTDFLEFIKDEGGKVRKNIGFDKKSKSYSVEMDVKVLDSIYGEGTPSNKESGWYGALPSDFESVIIEAKEFSIKENVQHELNEAIIITGKRGAKKVFNQLVKIWNEYPAFGANDKSHKLGVLKQLFFDAMEDANFSREALAIMKTIKGNIKPVTIKVAELGGVELKLPMPKIREAISELASRIATAGEWGGITIVEGTAMFLDYLKETKTAENLLNGFNAQFESVQIMESRVSEGRAFVAAARKAKDEGLKEFEYDGNTYPVLLKENKTVLNEATRGQFGKIDKKGNISSVYMHYDSNPENILPIIKQSFKDGKNVDSVISKGNFSGLDKKVDSIKHYNDDTVGEIGNIKKVKDYLKSASDESGAEYVYLWDESSKSWMMADIYADMKLVPAFESIVTEEEVEEGNAFGDAVRKAKEAGKKEFEFEGETFKVEETEEVEEAIVTEAKFDKKKLIKAMKQDDGIIQLANGDEFIIYNPDNGNDENTAMWNDKVIFALDQDGGEHEVKYSDIVSYNESEVNEGKSGVNTFLANIANDYQFDKKHDHYSGFLNTEPSDMGDDAIEFINNVDKYKSLMKKHGLSLEPGYSDDEAIFIKESEVNEAEIKSDEEFTEYANTVLQKAFGEDFDEAKAKEAIDGILSKSDGDYGTAVGILTSSLG